MASAELSSRMLEFTLLISGVLTMSRVATPYLKLEEVWPLYRTGNLFRILLTNAERLG